MRATASCALMGGLALLALAQPAVAAGPRSRDSGSSLGAVIDRAMRAGEPFFSPAEQAVINRKCGYAPGEWDPYTVSIGNGVLHCTNGRNVDDAEIRALVKVASPRISRRVNAAMARPEVQEAISRIASEAAAAAVANMTFDWKN